MSNEAIGIIGTAPLHHLFTIESFCLRDPHPTRIVRVEHGAKPTPHLPPLDCVN